MARTREDFEAGYTEAYRYRVQQVYPYWDEVDVAALVALLEMPPDWVIKEALAAPDFVRACQRLIPTPPLGLQPPSKMTDKEIEQHKRMAGLRTAALRFDMRWMEGT